MAIKDNIKILRTRKGYSQQELADILGVTNRAVSAWETGKTTPKMVIIEKLSELFAVPKSMIMDDGALNIYRNKDLSPVRKRVVPVLGRIAAGEPIFIDEHIEEYVPADEDVKVDFALRVQGDSMINAGINDGDIVFIKKQPTVEDGQIAAVLLDGSAMLRRVHRFQEYVQLLPENPKYEPTYLSPDNHGTFKFLGLATMVIKKL